METDELIQSLSSSPTPVAPGAVARRILFGLGLGAATSVALMIAWLGPRPDLAAAMAMPMFWMKFAYAALTALLLTAALARVARPGARLGAFAVTTGIGLKELCDGFRAKHDDYNAIMAEALADRLAEAFAEYLHRRARIDWGYGADEDLSNEDLIDEKYRGIRPAFGFSACTAHTEKAKLFDLLGARVIGMDLTESFAMTPAASVSGIYLAHPKTRYFNVGRVGRVQVEDYASARLPGPEPANRGRPDRGLRERGHEPARPGRDAGHRGRR